MSNEKIVFRSSVNGYNKKDVYKYLEAVNKDIAQKCAEFEKKISDAHKETDAVKEQNETLRKELGETSAAVAEKNKEIEALKARNFEMEKTLKELTTEASQRDALVEELDRAIVKLSVELDSISAQYAQLSENYESIKREISEIDTVKRKAAAYDKIAQRAREQIRTEVHKEEPKMNCDNTERSCDINADIDSILTGSAEKIPDHINEAQASFTSAIMNAQSETDALKRRISNVLNSSKKCINSHIEES